MALTIAARLLSGGFDLGTWSNLPEPLQGYLAELFERELTLTDWLSGLTVLLRLVAALALMVFAFWSRHAFLFFIMAEAALLGTYPLVLTPMGAVFFAVELILSGVVTGAAYTAPLKQQFTRKKPSFSNRTDLRVLVGVLVGAMIGLAAVDLWLGVAFLAGRAQLASDSVAKTIGVSILATVGITALTALAKHKGVRRFIASDDPLRRALVISAGLVVILTIVFSIVL